jgi:two-component system, chemotaxis family, response regulator PixG
MVETQEKLAGLSFKDLIIQIKNIKAQSFSGNLLVRVENNLSWTLSFRLGRLGWVNGGVDSLNCWQRHLNLANLELPLEKLAQINNPQKSTLDSNILAELLVEELIDREKCANLVGMMTVENLFDIIQFSQHCGNRLSYKLQETGAGNSQLNLILPLLEIEPILTKSIQTWQEWANAGLAVYAPSLFPVVSKSPDNTELNPTLLAIDGNRSLRSLAINNRQSVLEFTTSLLPLLRAGFINLSPQPKSRSKPPNSDISDRLNGADASDRLTGLASSPLSGNISDRSPLSGQISAGVGSSVPLERASVKQGALVACVDDSILIYQALERILTENGYRSYGVQDPLRIMPSLIRNKPDFIFLDLLMPITNGYEVCEQIRKTPSLKDIPVIILTGKDGLVDRMRSKMVGATGFLGKPVESDAVLKMLKKYLVVGN